MREAVEVGKAPAPRLGPRDDVDIAVGATIRLLRQARGVSQAALAAEVGVSFQQVQKYESGANRVSASMLSKIADTLAYRERAAISAAKGPQSGPAAGEP